MKNIEEPNTIYLRGNKSKLKKEGDKINNSYHMTSLNIYTIDISKDSLLIYYDFKYSHEYFKFTYIVISIRKF